MRFALELPTYVDHYHGTERIAILNRQGDQDPVRREILKMKFEAAKIDLSERK